MKVRDELLHAHDLVGDFRDEVRAFELVASVDQVPSSLDAELRIIGSGEAREGLAETVVVLLEALVGHRAEESFAQGAAAEAVAVLVHVKDVVSRQLVEEQEDAPLGLADEPAAEFERGLLPLQAQTLDQAARFGAEQAEAEEERVSEGGGYLGIGAARRESPDPVDVANDLLRRELPQELDRVKGLPAVLPWSHSARRARLGASPKSERASSKVSAGDRGVSVRRTH